jgi:hypothetical protein
LKRSRYEEWIYGALKKLYNNNKNQTCVNWGKGVEGHDYSASLYICGNSKSEITRGLNKENTIGGHEK